MCLCRSDIPYAALWGDDPIPERSHVLLATWLKPDTRFKALGEQLSTQLVSLPLSDCITLVLLCVGLSAGIFNAPTALRLLSFACSSVCMQNVGIWVGASHIQTDCSASQHSAGNKILMQHPRMSQLQHAEFQLTKLRSCFYTAFHKSQGFMCDMSLTINRSQLGFCSQLFLISPCSIIAIFVSTLVFLEAIDRLTLM